MGIVKELIFWRTANKGVGGETREECVVLQMSSPLSLSVPPNFDVNNYAYWKVRMRAFFMSINEDFWKSAEVGWKHPEKDMTKEEEATCTANNKAFNMIFVMPTKKR